MSGAEVATEDSRETKEVVGEVEVVEEPDEGRRDPGDSSWLIEVEEMEGEVVVMVVIMVAVVVVAMVVVEVVVVVEGLTSSELR